MTDVASISLILSLKTAVIAAESIFLPSFLLNTASQSFNKIDEPRMIAEARENLTGSGVMIFSTEDFKNSIPIKIINNATINAVMYSVLP